MVVPRAHLCDEWDPNICTHVVLWTELLGAPGCCATSSCCCSATGVHKSATGPGLWRSRFRASSPRMGATLIGAVHPCTEQPHCATLIGVVPQCTARAALPSLEQHTHTPSSHAAPPSLEWYRSASLVGRSPQRAAFLAVLGPQHRHLEPVSMQGWALRARLRHWLRAGLDLHFETTSRGWVTFFFTNCQQTETATCHSQQLTARAHCQIAVAQHLRRERPHVIAKR